MNAFRISLPLIWWCKIHCRASPADGRGPEDAVVGAAVAPAVNTTAVTLIKSVLAFVSIAVGKRSPSESVPSEMEKGADNACVSNESSKKVQYIEY